MTFYLSLDAEVANGSQSVEPQAAPTLSPDASLEEQQRELLMLGCRRLAETLSARFCVSGFGDELWKVDVKTDLSIILEQVPEAMRLMLHEGKPFEMNFYEQGLERYVSGVCESGIVTWSCMSMRANWQPNPPTESAPATDVRAMLRKLVTMYDELLRRVWPEAVATAAHHSWKRKVFDKRQ